MVCLRLFDRAAEGILDFMTREEGKREVGLGRRPRPTAIMASTSRIRLNRGAADGCRIVRLLAELDAPQPPCMHPQMTHGQP